MSRRVLRWREGKHGKRIRKSPAPPKREPIPVLTIVYGIALALTTSTAIFILAMALLHGAGIPAFISYGILSPVPVLGMLWGSRNKFFYVVVGATGALWIAGTAVLAANSGWTEQSVHRGADARFTDGGSGEISR